MNADNKHIIQTMCFDTQADSEETAIAFADKLKTIDCEVLLSKVLRNYDEIFYKIKIDSLTIDAGNIDLNDLDKLEEEIIQQLKNVLDKQFSARIINEESFFNNDVEVQIETDIIQTQIDVLIYYLLNGSLPWNTTERPDIKNLLFEIANKNVLKLKQALMPHLGKIYVTDRLISLLDIDEIIMLAEKLTEKKLSAVQKITDVLIEEIPSLYLIELKQELTLIYIDSIQQAIINNKDVESVFIQSLHSLLKKYPASFLESVLLKMHKLQIAFNTNKEQLICQLFLEELQKIMMQQQFSENKFLLEETHLTIQQEPIAEEEIKINTQKYNKENENAEPDEKQEYFYPYNAGIVLLNPALLQKYFEQFGWVKNKEITDELSMHKIIAWTDLLVWGEHKMYEYDLMLNKLLTGIHPSDVCDINISLSENEIFLADEFLKTIIEHWTILKNTGIESLRNSFLQRKGRLSNEDGGWQLHVESRGYDILIDSLPWSFSIIKFPWMTKPLFTQWQTKI